MKKQTVKVKILFVNFLILFISLVISFLFCEIIIRIIAPQNLNGPCYEYTDKGLRVNKSKGSAKAQYGNRIVRYNYHYPHLRDTPLKEGSIKILTVGDSFTFGVLLDKVNVITYHLQQYADKEFGKEKFYFLNAGTGGWGTADYVAFVEDFSEEIKPDIVLALVNTDDIGRSIKSKLFNLTAAINLGLKRNILKSSYFKKCVNSIPGYQWFLEYSHLVQLLRKSWLLFTQQNKTYKSSADVINGPNSSELRVSSEYAIKLGQALFVHLKKWCLDRGVDLYITTTGWHQWENMDNIFEPTRLFMSTTAEFFKSIDVPFYDISPHIAKIKKETGNRYILPEGHPDEEGDKLIAENIWRYFLKQQLADYLYSKRLIGVDNEIK